MKKLLGIMVLGLLWCNVSFAVSNVDLIRNCAEFIYDKKLTDKEYREIMTPENERGDHEFIGYFMACEQALKKHPITFREIYK